MIRKQVGVDVQELIRKNQSLDVNSWNYSQIITQYTVQREQLLQQVQEDTRFQHQRQTHLQ